MIKSARDFPGSLPVFLAPTNVLNAIRLPFTGGLTSRRRFVLLYRVFTARSAACVGKRRQHSSYSGPEPPWNAAASFSQLPGFATLDASVLLTPQAQNKR